MPRVIPIVLSIALMVFALADCTQTPDNRVRGIPKWAWIVLIVLIPWVGALTWLLVGKDRGRGGFGNASPRPVRRSGPLAPDEDPEFLRKLDEDIRRERRERQRREQELRDHKTQDPESRDHNGGHHDGPAQEQRPQGDEKPTDDPREEPKDPGDQSPE